MRAFNDNSQVTPLISIIIPVYNVEKYLSRCLDSVVNQTYKNLEIIIVDDGSTDDSGRICDEYKKRDDRIKVYHKENGGLSDARNFGIGKASGDYIGFVDSDDWISENMFNELKNLIIKNHADIAVCGIARIAGDHLKPKQPKVKITKYSQEEYVKKYFKIESQSIEYYAWNKLYKSELLSPEQYPYGLTSEDVLGTYKTIIKAKKIVTTNQKYYYYFKNPTGITSDISKNIFDQIDVWDMVVEYTSNHAPKYNDWAIFNRERMPLNILHKCAGSLPYTKLKKNQILPGLLRELQANKSTLLKSKISLGRKIAVILYCKDYYLFSRIPRFYNMASALFRSLV